MSISAGPSRSTHRRRTVVAVIVTPLLLASVGAMSQPASASAVPKITAATAHPGRTQPSRTFPCEVLKNWLDNHPANTAQWRKVSLMWLDQGCPGG